MLNEQTFDKLYAMKFIGMAEGFKETAETIFVSRSLL